jgi:hypothetical protein
MNVRFSQQSGWFQVRGVVWVPQFTTAPEHTTMKHRLATPAAFLLGIFTVGMLAYGAFGSAGHASEGEGTYRADLAPIVEGLSAQGYTNVHDLEREHARIEATARDAQGRWVELEIDPASGRVLDSEREDRAHR